MISRFSLLKLLLVLGVFDSLSIGLLIVFYIYNLDFMFLVNYNFIIILCLLIVGSIIGDLKKILQNKYVIFCFFVLFLSLIQVFLGYLDDANLNSYFIFTHFYSILIMLFSFAFASRFSENDYSYILKIFRVYAFYYLIIASIFLSIYALLYFSGKISYFGMGSNLHYAIPFYIKSMPLMLAMFFIVLMSGKRAVLVNTILQYSVYRISNMSYKKLMFYVVFLLAPVVYYLGLETNLMYRFKGIFEVDFSDNYSVLVAFGGRFEEMVGIYEFYINNLGRVLFGAYPGEGYNLFIESYHWSNSGEMTSLYDITKNSAHVTLFAFVFRYGIIVALLMMMYFSYVLIRYYNPRNEFYLVFIGILSSSFFGSNLLSDPISWIFIAFYLKFRHFSITSIRS